MRLSPPDGPKALVFKESRGPRRACTCLASATVGKLHLRARQREPRPASSTHRCGDCINQIRRMGLARSHSFTSVAISETNSSLFWRPGVKCSQRRFLPILIALCNTNVCSLSGKTRSIVTLRCVLTNGNVFIYTINLYEVSPQILPCLCHTDY